MVKQLFGVIHTITLKSLSCALCVVLFFLHCNENCRIMSIINTCCRPTGAADMFSMVRNGCSYRDRLPSTNKQKLVLLHFIQHHLKRTRTMEQEFKKTEHQTIKGYVMYLQD